MKYLGAPQSGSQANTTASRNNTGQYYRNRSIPVNPRSVAQLRVRAAFSSNASAWRNLTDAQRAGWKDLGTQISVKDALGQSHKLNGFQAFISVNNNNLAAGQGVLTDAPALISPPVLLTATVTLTHTVFSVAYTATPLATGNQLEIWVSGQRSAGVTFNKGYTLLVVTAAAAASPANIFAAYSAKYGTPLTGNRIFMRFVIFQGGFVGQPLDVAQVIA